LYRYTAATEMFLLYYLADENERRHPAAASEVDWRSTANANATTRSRGGGASVSSQSPERAAHNVARVVPVIMSLLFDGWGSYAGGGSSSSGGSAAEGCGSASAVGASTSERVAQTAAVILAHFADSEVNSAAMVRGGALGTLQRALKARSAVGSVVDDPLLRLIRDVMGRLVNDSNAGADFMRTALKAAAQYKG
jgi:hypothetical protein